MKGKLLFVKIEKVFLYFNIFFAFFLLFSYLSVFVSPKTFWPPAFFSLGYLILLAINLLFCLYWAIRLKRYFLISFLCVLAGYHVLLNHIGFHTPVDEATYASSTHLKLMTYNARNFSDVHGARGYPPTYLPVLDIINTNKPDIIGFEEFNTHHAFFNICDSIQKKIHSDQFYFEPFIQTDRDSTGLALFSKYPVINKGVIRFSEEKNENQCIFIDVKYKTNTIRVYAFHLQSLELKPKDYYILSKLSHEKIVSTSGIKEILYKIKEGFVKRAHQVDLVRDHAAKCPYPYIFMGDFNDTPGSYVFNKMSEGMVNTFREKGSGLGKTFNGGFASFQIDYILVNKQFQVFNYRIIPKKLSDHYPVFSTVDLK